MRPPLGFRATHLNLTHSLAVRKEVKSSSLCKLWAHQIHKNIVLHDLGFVVRLLAVKLHWHPEHFVHIWSGWLTGNSTGRHRKIHSLRHVLKQSRSRGRMVTFQIGAQTQRERERRPPCLLPISYWITLDHFRPKTTSQNHSLLKEVRPIPGRVKEIRANQIWWCTHSVSCIPGTFYLSICTASKQNWKHNVYLCFF